MTFVLFQPMGLLALLALAVPLVLHLARRSEHHAIDFAALRWLAVRARPRRRVRVVERGLLALRSLLIGLLALLLAEPMHVGSERGPAWTVIAPGVDPASIPGRRFEDGAEWRWLAPGFPDLESAPPVGGTRVASLLRELDASLPLATALTVWVPREVSGLDGARIQLQRKVEWRIAPGRAPLTLAPSVPPMAFAVRHGADRNEALRYLRAAAQAWSVSTVSRDSGTPTLTKAPTIAASTDVADSASVPLSRAATLVWLRAGALPSRVREWVSGGGTLLIEPRTPWAVAAWKSAIVWRDEAGRPLARAMRVGRGRVVRLEVPLAAAHLPTVLDGEFAPALRHMLHPRDLRFDRALASEVAPDVRALQGKRPPASTGTDGTLALWLALLIAMLFVLERVVATSPHRWRSQ